MDITATELEIAWHQATRRPLGPDDAGAVRAFVEDHPEHVGEPSMEDLDVVRSHIEETYGEVPSGLNLVELAKLTRTAAVLATLAHAGKARENAPNN